VPCPDDSNTAAAEIQAVYNRGTGKAMRSDLFECGAVVPMLEALWGITSLLVESTRSDAGRVKVTHRVSRSSKQTEVRPRSAWCQMHTLCQGFFKQ
jgi:hypothetical protein